MDFTVPYRSTTFPGRHEGEQILLVLRRHWFTLVTTGLLFTVLVGLPLGIALGIPVGLLAAIRASIWGSVVLLSVTAYYLFLWLFFFTVLVDYYLDVWIVTNERIVNILQEGLFHRIIAEQSVVRVQDVTSDVQGIIPTFLNFGNVYAQTAGERERFIFLNVPNPDQVKKVIIQAHEVAVRGLLQQAQVAMIQTGEAIGSPHTSHGVTEQL